MKASTVTSMVRAPASMAFSTSSFTAEAGRSTTSPAAMRSTSTGSRRRTEGAAAVMDICRQDNPWAVPIQSGAGRGPALRRADGCGRRSGHLREHEAILNTGATDLEIHDTVLIAAAFSMFNRYVDALGTLAPSDPGAYGMGASRIVAHGYLAPS